MIEEIKHLIELEATRGSNFVEQSLGYKPDSDAYNLTETEFLVIRMLVSNGQSLIQRALYEGREPSELEKLLWRYLDDALAKLPTEDTTEIVFRNTNNNIFTSADVGREKVYPAYLTASRKCLSTTCNTVYFIHLAGRTKAKSIYKTYEVMPELPEEQVEFPRNTKFYVEDVCSKGGKTLVKLWEMPDNSWPSEQLSGNVSAFFENITSIDIADAVDKGLNPRIHQMSSRSGKAINALCTSKGDVYISPTFTQALWNMCYVGLCLSDSRIIRENLEKEGLSLEGVCAEIDSNKCDAPECRYFKAIQDAYCWEDLLLLNLSLLQNKYTEKDNLFLGGIDTTGELERKVNGMCMTGMGFILLHELTHFYEDHHERVNSSNRRVLEQEADDLAFDAILSSDGEIYKTAILGGLAPLLLEFYRNPPLKESPNYYREDVRLFRQYDKITVEKRRASIFVANVLKDWLYRFRSITVEIMQDKEEDTVEDMRKIIKGL